MPPCGGTTIIFHLSELLIRLELTDAYAPVGYIYNPPKPSFEKEGFRGRQPNPINDKKQVSPKGNTCFS